jgi:hypothetical protein
MGVGAGQTCAENDDPTGGVGNGSAAFDDSSSPFDDGSSARV